MIFVDTNVISETLKKAPAPDGMIAAVAKIHGGRLATRNTGDFLTAGLALTNPWDF